MAGKRKATPLKGPQPVKVKVTPQGTKVPRSQKGQGSSGKKTSTPGSKEKKRTHVKSKAQLRKAELKRLFEYAKKKVSRERRRAGKEELSFEKDWRLSKEGRKAARLAGQGNWDNANENRDDVDENRDDVERFEPFPERTESFVPCSNGVGLLELH